MANTRVRLLPHDLHYMIANYSGQAATFFAPLTNNPTLIRKYTVVQPFLNDVLCGQEERVSAYLTNDPTLLYEADRGINFSGQIFENSTALQLAWGARDYRMCSLILDFFERNDQLAFARSQIEAKFPEHLPVESLPYNFDYIRTSFLTNTQVREAVTKFKEDFAPSLVTYGYHFNVHNLDYACWMYDTELAGISQALRAIFWREVIGYLHRLVPAHLASAMSYGLYNIVEEKHDPRPGIFSLCGNKQYYPLDTDLNERLGFEVAIHSNAGAKMVKQLTGQARSPSHDPDLSLLIKYHQQQETKFVQLRQRMIRPAPRCKVM